MEMGSKHKGPKESIQIIKTCVVPTKEARREATRQYASVGLRFPKVKPVKRAPTRGLRATFKVTKPLII